ncbi:prephenate dehydratase [Moheibacter sediminis]|uniref:prephenate dehydratase n=1 Tax=Moheibacter sediminis TaxID=1434700 RepID=A0A1W2CVJ7_9FLAO|nr:prephenate dehydratase [Moheibacter sediminis]SMC88748.1 prephenate dehydratase [Moheibacter sediminis]
MKIGIQGTLGSYHHQAADLFFNSEEFILYEYESFKKVAKSVSKSECDFGLMAIENTIAGSILPNYSLVTKYNLQIVGEIYLPIQHQLMALPGTDFDKIEEIRSHPMAILQCDQFLEKYNHFTIRETSDTALTAKKIKSELSRNIAAIASQKAADLYGLEILKRNIQTFHKNFTRFFVLAKETEPTNDFDKASITFATPHKSGSLANVLNEFVYLGINMEKIQSIPIIEKPWQYNFHVDISFETIQQYEELKKRILIKTDNLKILGEYKKNNPYLLKELEYIDLKSNF